MHLCSACAAFASVVLGSPDPARASFRDASKIANRQPQWKVLVISLPIAQTHLPSNNTGPYPALFPRCDFVHENHVPGCRRMTRISVDPAPRAAAQYDVVIEAGALARLPELLGDIVPAFRYAIISDDRVAHPHGLAARRALTAAGLRAELLEFPAGEASKTRGTWERLSDELITRGYGRDSCIVALGGGVTCDMAGFVAATFLRGVPVLQVPTSLLAMVDASIGGKTGVDTQHGKNLIGAFHQPAAVIIDPVVLRTLPEAELRNGLAETVKHAAIADERYLDSIDADREQIVARNPEALAALVARSVEIKAGYVSADPLEAGPRKALNYGHTVGHAVEALTRYAVPHGSAVAIGMVAEALLGEAMEVTEQGSAARLRDVIERLALPTRLPDGMRADTILGLMARDKKARAGHVETTLLRRVGEVARNGDGWSFPLDTALATRILATPPFV
jgi:3-dehydroquinate synthase